LKALFVNSPGKVALRDVEKPTPKEGEILVKMKCCGVCGTDIEKVNGEALTPMVLGHEVVGEIVEIGKNVKELANGDRVFTHHHTPCYSCTICRRGDYTLCNYFPRYNLHPCGFSEYYTVPRWNVERGAVVKLADDMSYEEASFIEPLGCCIRGLEKINAKNFSSASIYGAGPTGLLHLKLLKFYGCERVSISDVSRYRLKFAEKIGADSTFDPRDDREREGAISIFEGGKPELALVATGNTSALDDALKSVAKGGTVLLFGAPPKNSSIHIKPGDLFINGINLATSYSTSEKEILMAKELLQNSSISVADLVTHRFKLTDAYFAFEIAQQQQCIKALVLG
jgi:L-iditol 2-dehydrogenase